MRNFALLFIVLIGFLTFAQTVVSQDNKDPNASLGKGIGSEAKITDNDNPNIDTENEIDSKVKIASGKNFRSSGWKKRFTSNKKGTGKNNKVLATAKVVGQRIYGVNTYPIRAFFEITLASLENNNKLYKISINVTKGALPNSGEGYNFYVSDDACPVSLPTARYSAGTLTEIAGAFYDPNNNDQYWFTRYQPFYTFTGKYFFLYQFEEFFQLSNLVSPPAGEFRTIILTIPSPPIAYTVGGPNVPSGYTETIVACGAIVGTNNGKW
jgi:hypothetical protein